MTDKNLRSFFERPTIRNHLNKIHSRTGTRESEHSEGPKKRD